ncbi:MoxR family ATPase [Candidatus Chloroploca sp. M-50]|uniref:MoxR family ATPase n=1 Tax=Candidatus Chloroploca mongolica TaxID=2528176 RepID=A0ABS4DG20_9CHLR|nr:MoxR family ATPase [Candidatus Chloroploca mongolica]MBP1468314.1 MoxR family ATPase [Candidatus Chloroploca mongolica]
MLPRSAYVFAGDMEHEPAERHPDAPTHLEPYLASPELVRAVNLAIHLGRPLLLEGEAGCGKTRLAHAVAAELGLPLYPWYVRSNSKAQDGLYAYDAIRRLHDAQVHHLLAGQTEDTSRSDPGNPQHYVQMGAIGKAFELRDRPAVVLIDEIDKADIDFPNDLLTVLDEPWAFEIQETGQKIQAVPAYRPIIVITSNKEKGNLPAPFLRRCIYHFITFPEAQLKTIVATHFARRGMVVPPTTDLAITRFLALRNGERLHKKPGTSEFLDWLEALANFKPASQLTADGPLPYPEVLLKLRADWHAIIDQR